MSVGVRYFLLRCFWKKPYELLFWKKGKAKNELRLKDEDIELAITVLFRIACWFTYDYPDSHIIPKIDH